MYPIAPGFMLVFPYTIHLQQLTDKRDSRDVTVGTWMNIMLVGRT